MKLREVQRKGFLAVLLLKQKLSGMRYAVRVLISGAIVWFLLAVVAHVDPLWGLISAVVVTDLKVKSALNNFASRMLNTLIGCGTGLLFLKLFGASAWVVLLAMALSVIIASDVVRVPISWRIAPITTAIVMTPAYLLHSSHAGMTAAIQRTGEVVVGSVVAVIVSVASAGLLRWLRAGTGPPKAS
jgi:uncharacterized membrane protein YccC